MTVTLTYDSALARVRITANALAAADYATVERSTDQIMWTTVRGGVEAPIVFRADLRHLFGTTAASGWGTADTGQSTVLDGGSASDFSVSGGAGQISNGSVAVLRSVFADATHQDFEVSADVLMPITAPTGSSYTRWVLARVADTANYYAVRLMLNTSGNVSLAIFKRVAASLLALTSGGGDTAAGANTAGNMWRVVFKGRGTALEARAQNLTTAGAVTTVTGIDETFSGGTRFGVSDRLETGNTTALPVVGQWDNWTAGPRVAELDDYEFVSGSVNYYRVRGIESGAITFVAAGVAATANNTSVMPAHPAGLIVGDLKVTLASIRNSGTGSVNVPTGWTLMRAFGNMALLGRRHVSGDTAPTVTFAGGVANADTLAQMAAFRRAELVPVTGADQLNSSAQNVGFPALTMPVDSLLAIVAAWKQDDTSGVTPIAGMAEIGEANSTAGDDASQAWDYVIQTIKANISAGTLAWAGGGAAISRAMTVAIRHADFLNEQSANITPVLDSIWLKSVTRPFLNRRVTVVDWTAEERPARSGSFAAVGRTYDIGVTDVAGGLQFELDLHVATREDAQTLDYIRASGDILYLHCPAGCPVPGGHLCVDTTSARRVRPRGDSRVFTLPVRQCAAPGPDVVGATSTWQTVLGSYATWADVLAANPTWADLLARVAPPSEVIVP